MVISSRHTFESSLKIALPTLFTCFFKLMVRLTEFFRKSTILRYNINRIHGAGIYANIKGVYGWDPWHTIYSSTMDPMGNINN